MIFKCQRSFLIEKLGKFNWTINSNNWLFFSRTNCVIINLLCTLWYCSIFSVESLIFAIASVIGPFFIIFYFIMCITKVLIDEM